MKDILLVLAILISFNTGLYANTGEALVVCFANRITATACLGILAVAINPAAYVIATALSSFAYSIYSYDNAINNCKKGEIHRSQVKRTKEKLEKLTNEITVDQYDYLSDIIRYVKDCQDRESFHKMHTKIQNKKIKPSKKELDDIFNWILSEERE